MTAVSRLFVPGWGAPHGFYSAGLPQGWEAVDLPSFRATRGDLFRYRRWLGAEIARRGTRVSLAGHSMGGALAVLAAADQPDLVAELILISPAGLPLEKPIRASTATFLGQVVRGCYPARELCRAIVMTALAPTSALRLAQIVHGLDLTLELKRVRTHAISCSVIGCSTDELTTPAHCRRVATLLNGSYREVDASDGHIWPISHPEVLTAELVSELSRGRRRRVRIRSET